MILLRYLNFPSTIFREKASTAVRIYVCIHKLIKFVVNNLHDIVIQEVSLHFDYYIASGTKNVTNKVPGY